LTIRPGLPIAPLARHVRAQALCVRASKRARSDSLHRRHQQRFRHRAVLFGTAT